MNGDISPLVLPDFIRERREHVAVIAVISTMDTKGWEAEFLREKITAGGHTALLLDVSTLNDPVGNPDIPSAAIMARAPSDLVELAHSGSKEHTIAAMAHGAARVLQDQAADG